MPQVMTGWNFLSIVVVLAIAAVIIVGVVLLLRGCGKSASAQPLPESIRARLQELDTLHAQGALTEEEYLRMREAILSEL